MRNRNGVTNPFSETKPEHETDNQAKLTPAHVEPTTNKPMVDSMKNEEQSLHSTNEDSDSPSSDHDGQAMGFDDHAHLAFHEPVSPQKRENQSSLSSIAKSEDVDLVQDANSTDDGMKADTFEQTRLTFDPLESCGDEEVDPVTLAEEAEHTDLYDDASHMAEPQEWEEHDSLTGAAQSEQGNHSANPFGETEQENLLSQEELMLEPVAAVSKAAKPAAKKKAAKPLAAVSKAAKPAAKKKVAKPLAAVSKAVKPAVKKKVAKPLAAVGKAAKSAVKKKSARPVAAPSQRMKEKTAASSKSSAKKSPAGAAGRTTRSVTLSRSLGTPRPSASTRLASNQTRAVDKKIKLASSARVALTKGNKPSARQASSKKTSTSISAIVSQLVRGGVSRTSTKTKRKTSPSGGHSAAGLARVPAKRQGAAVTVARSAPRSAPSMQKATKQRAVSRTPSTKSARAKRS